MSLLTTYSYMTPSAIIDPVAENTWSRSGTDNTCSCLLLPLVVNVFDVEGVDVAWEVSENCQADVYEQVGATASH